MKKIFIISVYFFLVFPVFAISPTATPSAKVSTASSFLEKSIQTLKEKIATQVAKIEKEKPKLFTGNIEKIDKTNFVLKTLDNKTFTVQIEDSLSKIYIISGATKKEVKITDLETSDYVIVTGPSLESTISAVTVYKDEEYLSLSGKITDIINDDYTLKVLTSDKDEYEISIENTTKQMLYDIKNDIIAKTGFSKIKANDTIHFVCKKPADKKNFKVTADRILIIPQEYFVNK